MFVIVHVQTGFRTCVGMFVTYLRTVWYKPSPNGSSVMAIRQEGKVNYRTAAMLLCYILQNKNFYHNRVA
jgi:hypothetical protein